MPQNDITSKARKVARHLSYSSDTHQAQAKHLLLEMASKIDQKNIRVHKKSDGLLLIDGLGKARFMTIKERLLYAIFGVRPERV